MPNHHHTHDLVGAAGIFLWAAGGVQHWPLLQLAGIAIGAGHLAVSIYRERRLTLERRDRARAGKAEA